ncbi:hypothetical protein EVAR_64934_1 [Eumeta japonica]|uniref:Uncharacterized protein n=1 Tax=Eumeta variegata TaxID=151549 RepID=A0A4C1Z9J4_EUMVA|nr:hypothetical protein EVAR_64934_1 [Eumeta japonica]
MLGQRHRLESHVSRDTSRSNTTCPTTKSSTTPVLYTMARDYSRHAIKNNPLQRSQVSAHPARAGVALVPFRRRRTAAFAVSNQSRLDTGRARSPLSPHACPGVMIATSFLRDMR